MALSFPMNLENATFVVDPENPTMMKVQMELPVEQILNLLMATATEEDLDMIVSEEQVAVEAPRKIATGTRSRLNVKKSPIVKVDSRLKIAGSKLRAKSA